MVILFKNLGECKTESEPFRCQCKAGWTGNDCGTPDCGNSLCVNGGIFIQY